MKVEPFREVIGEQGLLGAVHDSPLSLPVEWREFNVPCHIATDISQIARHLYLQATLSQILDTTSCESVALRRRKRIWVRCDVERGPQFVFEQLLGALTRAIGVYCCPAQANNGYEKSDKSEPLRRSPTGEKWDV